MEKLCLGCMQPKNQSPICEHCGYSELEGNKPHQLAEGSLLRGQYRVGKVLGQGGFGITYLGYDENLEIPVAIKEYFPTGMVTRDAATTSAITVIDNGSLYATSLDRFLAEAKTLARLGQVPGIVRVQNFFAENGTAYIVMEYLKGCDLRDYMARGGRPLTAQETFRLLRPVMQALGRVHQAGLVHRDISPDNIMIGENGEVKLLDFGTARQVEVTSPDQEVQHSTEAILKHGFAPFEQYQRRGGVGPWTDVYALCATAYYCLTGRVPKDALECTVDGTGVDWDSVPGLTAGQRQALADGMRPFAKDRTPSMEALERALFEGARPVPRPEPAPVKPGKPRKQKKGSGLLTALWILAACLAVAVGFAALRNTGSDDGTRQKVQDGSVQEAPATAPATEKPAYAQAVEIDLYMLEDEGSNDAWLHEAMNRFSQRYNVELTVTANVLGSSDVKAQIDVMLASGIEGIFAVDSAYFTDYAEAGALLPFEGEALELLRQSHPNAVNAYQWEGQYYGAPYGANTWFMYYDTSVYTQEDIRSLETMMLKKPVSLEADNAWYLSAFYFGAGCTIDDSVHFGGSAGTAATAWLAEAYGSGGLTANWYGDAFSPLASGKAGAVMSGKWDASLAREILGDNYGAAALPAFTLNGQEVQPAPFVSYTAYCVSAYTSETYITSLFAAYLASEEVQWLRSDYGRWAPCAIPLLEELGQTDPMYLALSQVLSGPVTYQRENPVMTTFWGRSHWMGEELQQGRVTSGNAAQKAEHWNRLLNGG